MRVIHRYGGIYTLILTKIKERLPRRYAPRNDAGVTPVLGLHFCSATPPRDVNDTQLQAPSITYKKNRHP